MSWKERFSMDAIILKVISGLRAFTFQNYVEVNVKTGTQRVASTILTVTAGTQNHIGFRTGVNKMVIKARLINQAGSTRIDYSAREKLTFTGNIEDNRISIRNPNNIVQVPILCEAWHSVTPGTPDGNTRQYLDPFPIMSAGVNSASRIGSDTLGLEYVLNANTDHVFTIDNVGTGDATVHWWLTFFEGEPDLP